MSDRKQIRSYWKPDGKTVHAGNEKRIKDWLERHALSTAPGALTVILHSRVHESVRKHLARAMQDSPAPGKKEHQR
jgi:hypothetical protein